MSTTDTPRASNRLNLSEHPTLATRFWAKVLKTPTCWIWTARKCSSGYGAITIQTAPGKCKDLVASRVSWEFSNGPIPEGLNVLHRCDNPACVNPAHLFLGTQKDNGIDMVKKGRSYNRRVTDEMVREIRRSIDVSSAALGKKYGLHPGHVSKIRRGECAKHVPSLP